MLLRDETQLAMNQVETLCFEAADHYENAARRTAEVEAGHVLTERAQQLRGCAAELAPHIRRLDDLPQQPDPDRETVSEVFSGIRAFLSGAPERTLIDEQMALEDRLNEAVANALQRDVPADTRDLLKQMQVDIDAAKARLASVRV